jgi:F0F1-type ATP synthase assembly protein I
MVVRPAIMEEPLVLTRFPSAVKLLGIGWYFAVSIVGGAAGGMLLDGWLDTRPLFTLLGLFSGLALAFFGGLTFLMQVMKEDNAGKEVDEA